MIRAYYSKDYNFTFDTETGYFERWGKTKEEDPQVSEFGPEILDIEVSEMCHEGCKFCYKSNKVSGDNMSLETFKTVLDKMPKTLTQVAFGIGSIDTNPDLFEMMRYCQSKNIVPNVTINGSRMTDLYFMQLNNLCGAVAVSNYNKDNCYGAVKKLTDLGLVQVNIHQLLSKETIPQIWELLNDEELDNRLSRLNAIVFLSVKQKGRGVGYHRASDEDYKKIVDYCIRNNVRFGFDSCGAQKFLNAISQENVERFHQFVEPCESTLFSSYINVEGKFFPCSFAENDREEGLDVVNCEDFVKDIWMNPKTIAWRENLLNNGRNCPMYEI